MPKILCLVELALCCYAIQCASIPAPRPQTTGDSTAKRTDFAQGPDPLLPEQHPLPCAWACGQIGPKPLRTRDDQAEIRSVGDMKKRFREAEAAKSCLKWCSSPQEQKRLKAYLACSEYYAAEYEVDRPHHVEKRHPWCEAALKVVIAGSSCGGRRAVASVDLYEGNWTYQIHNSWCPDYAELTDRRRAIEHPRASAQTIRESRQRSPVGRYRQRTEFAQVGPSDSDSDTKRSALAWLVAQQATAVPIGDCRRWNESFEYRIELRKDGSIAELTPVGGPERKQSKCVSDAIRTRFRLPRRVANEVRSLHLRVLTGMAP